MHTLTLSGDRLEAEDRLGGVLVRVPWTLDEHFARRAVERSLAQLPKVAGAWRLGDERLTLDEAAVADPRALRLEACEHDGALTVCLTRDPTGDRAQYALIDGELAPAVAYPDCACGGGEAHAFVQSVLPGPAWVRDLPCARRAGTSPRRCSSTTSRSRSARPAR